MGLVTAEDSSCTFLMTKQILNSSQNCDSCYSPMVLTSCAVTKSADLFIWRCRPCMKTKNIRSGSVLQPGLQPAISTFPSPDILLLIEVDHQHQSRCLQVLTPLVIDGRNMAPNIQAGDHSFLRSDQSQLRVSVKSIR